MKKIFEFISTAVATLIALYLMFIVADYIFGDDDWPQLDIHSGQALPTTTVQTNAGSEDTLQTKVAVVKVKLDKPVKTNQTVSKVKIINKNKDTLPPTEPVTTTPNTPILTVWFAKTPDLLESKADATEVDIKKVDVESSTNISPDSVGSVAKGKKLFNNLACSSCHGASAQGVSAPALTGKTSDWIFTQLKAFQKGKRKSPVMQSMSLQAIGNERAIADFLETLK